VNNNLAFIKDMVENYANDEDIKIASAAADKKVLAYNKQKKKEQFQDDFSEAVKTFIFPVFWGGLSFISKEIANKDNSSTNFMASFNAMFTIGTGGFFLGFLMGGDNLRGALFGGLLGSLIGIPLGLRPAVYNTFNNSRVLYYMPVIITAIIALNHYFDFWW